MRPAICVQCKKFAHDHDTIVDGRSVVSTTDTMIVPDDSLSTV